MNRNEDSGEETTIIAGISDRRRNGGVSRAQTASLKVTSAVAGAGGLQRTVAIDRRHFTIGRSSACNLVLNDQKTSRIHAQVVDVGGKHIVEDLGSVNGTYLDGKFIKKAVLEPGNVIKIGDTELEYTVHP